MSDTSPCPQCGAPAEITERFWLDATDGPIEHLKIGCLSKHSGPGGPAAVDCHPGS
jgi:hypothetical protein